MAILGTLKVTTPTDREIVITRLFEAPRRLVWEAMTRPELLKRWLFGPPGWSMTFCQNDLTVGAAFRWVWRGPDGREMTMRGENREVVPLNRIVRTESFESGCEAKAGEQLAMLVLTERDEGGDPDGQGGRTVLRLTLRYPTKEARDAGIASGIDRSMAAAYDGLEKLLATIPLMKNLDHAA